MQNNAFASLLVALVNLLEAHKIKAPFHVLSKRSLSPANHERTWHSPQAIGSGVPYRQHGFRRVFGGGRLKLPPHSVTTGPV
jgi:hypothetical protein